MTQEKKKTLMYVSKYVLQAKSVAARLRWEKKRQDDREKKEQVERAARLQFEQQLEIEPQVLF